jgi:AraC-like DNA-binding protein
LSLLGSSREDPLRGLLLESHALTLLREQLLQLLPQKIKSVSYQTASSRTLAEQLEEARRILEQSPQSSPKLSELAAMTGLNEWTLKKGFRARFGATVYDYLRVHRMKIADAMLCSGDYNVNETALAVGYKNAGCFSMAYRREFGTPPKTRQMFSRIGVPAMSPVVEVSF